MSIETKDKLIFSTFFNDHYKGEEEYVANHEIYSSIDVSFTEELDSLWEEFFYFVDKLKGDRILLLTGTINNRNSYIEVIKDVYEEFVYVLSDFTNIQVFQEDAGLFIYIYRGESIDMIEVRALNDTALKFIEEIFDGYIENISEKELVKLFDDKYSNKVIWDNPTLI